jgi:16S rRNA (guanine527-N7)-methyltransferase
MIDTARLIRQAAALGVCVTPDQAQLLDRYCQLVVETNRRLNLTAITQPYDMEVKHLLDSLTLCTLPSLRGSVADVGTGAGFPGVVLKIMRPDLRLTLIDATAKKLTFVQQSCERLGLDVTVVHGRAEELARGALREQFDTVVARAVAALPALCEYCLPLVAVGGAFIAMKGPEAAAELADSAYALSQLGARSLVVENFQLPGAITRYACVISKISQTAPKYPRNSNNISKMPLKKR